MGGEVNAPREPVPAPATYLLEDQLRMARAINYFAWQKRLVLRELGRRVVEVGCGIGNFTGNLLDRDIVIAIDAEPQCVERVQARYPDAPQLHVMTGDAAHLPDCGIEAYAPDSCVCLNVLEHVRDDQAAIRGMAAVLAPGGVIVLLVPAFPALYGPIDRLLEHQRRYTVNSIRELARDAGLRIAKCHYVNFAGFFGWWWNARVRKRSAQSEAQIAVFDRWIVPWLSRLEERVHPPFGQSIFAVLRKPVLRKP